MAVNEKPVIGLTEYKHQDPEKHLIGETLAAPSRIISTGIVTVGSSPIAAREDHMHFGVTAWTNVSFLNGWSNYAFPGWQGAQYRKIGDIVYLRGLVKGGTMGVGMFILPAGFTPPDNLLIAGISTGASAIAISRIDIQTDGQVLVSSPSGGNAWVSLTNVMFSTIA